MGYDLNFALLGQPVDVAGAVQTGYQHGRALRQQAQQDRAFEMLARDPNSAEARALLVASGHPEQARQFRQWGKEDANEAFRLRALGINPGATPPAAFPAANAAPSPAGAPPAAVSAFPAAAQPAASPAPAAGMGAPVPATPSAAPASTGRINIDPQVMRQWFATDPAGAREFLTSWNSMTEAQQEIATQRFTAAIPVLTQALSVPYEQRRSFIQAHAADLTTNGWSAEEIAGFDPTDANTQLMIRRGLPITQQRDFFAPIESAPGTVGRSRFGNRVEFANPSQPRTEQSWDANGNEILATVPGAPAIGPDAALFGGGAQAGSAAPAPTPAGTVREGRGGQRYRFRGGDVGDRNNWEPVPASTPLSRAPDWPVQGGAASGQPGFP